MAYISLSKRDINVLAKINDPESDPASALKVDQSLPKDPHIQDQDLYGRISRTERSIVLSMQQIESELSGMPTEEGRDAAAEYRKCIASLGDLVTQHPDYASARNNRAQALRRLCGDSMLVSGVQQPPQALLRRIHDSERQEMTKTVLEDLDLSISLLTPDNPHSAISPQAARTLSMAHTQRAAIYRSTAKLLAPAALSIAPERREAGWAKLEFEEAASRDFAMGGRYGNDIARGLAVSTNPTAKLCGQMVREAMKKEYGQQFAA
jgi:hypothetical protein